MYGGVQFLLIKMLDYETKTFVDGFIQIHFVIHSF